MKNSFLSLMLLCSCASCGSEDVIPVENSGGMLGQSSGGTSVGDPMKGRGGNLIPGPDSGGSSGSGGSNTGGSTVSMSGGSGGSVQPNSGGSSGSVGSGGAGGSLQVTPKDYYADFPLLPNRAIAGRVKFHKVFDGIEISGTMDKCTVNGFYTFRILEGTSCPINFGQVPTVWGGDRGRTTAVVECANGTGTFMFKHLEQGTRKWSMLDGSNLDILSRPFIIGPFVDAEVPIVRVVLACGMISVD